MDLLARSPKCYRESQGTLGLYLFAKHCVIGNYGKIAYFVNSPHNCQVLGNLYIVLIKDVQ